MSKLTIPDIARLAGVSSATVDRVLNRRPGVNPDTERKVQDIITQLGAAPSRGRPRRGDNLRLAFVLPAGARATFALIERHIALLAGQLRHQHVHHVTLRLDCHDPAVFAAGLRELDGYDGVAVLAPDQPVIKLAINELVRAGVHVVTLLSDLGGSMRESLIGADERGAGRLAGLLLGRMTRKTDALSVLLVSNPTRYSAEIERQTGFRQIMEEQFPWLEVLHISDLPEDDDAACAALRAQLEQRIDRSTLAGLYNVGAGTDGICAALQPYRSEQPCHVIAHTLTESKRALLLSNQLSFVLDLDLHYCMATAARVLQALSENVRGAHAVVQPQIQILTAENLM